MAFGKGRPFQRFRQARWSRRKFNPPDVLAYVLSENLHRRQITAGQRAAIGEEIANLKHGVRSDRSEKNLDIGRPISIPITREQAAEQIGTTAKAISPLRIIKERALAAAKKVAFQRGSSPLIVALSPPRLDSYKLRPPG
jgi:hypothetical protein